MRIRGVVLAGAVLVAPTVPTPTAAPVAAAELRIGVEDERTGRPLPARVYVRGVALRPTGGAGGASRPVREAELGER